MKRSTHRVMVPALLVLAAGQPVSVLAQDAPPPPLTTPATAAPLAAAPDGAVAAVEAQPVTPPAPAPAAQLELKLRFSFKDAPYDQVMDFVARQTGLPVIREAELPNAPVTFISATDYSLAEAIDVLNRMLFMHGLQLRKEENFLLLTKIENMKALGPKFHDQVPADVAAAQIITVVVPLHNASATALAEQLKGLIGPVGAITPLPQQNSLILVDTAAQCRRLRAVIDDLDSERPSDAQVKIFTLKHAKADAVNTALKGLVAEKRTTFFIDKDGKKTQVQDDTTPGLNLQPDTRTNSIIAVGPAAKLATVEELVAMLDKAEGADDDREIMTFALAGVTPDDATKTLTNLFMKAPAEQRPTLLPMAAQSKVTVVGTVAQLVQAAAVLGEMDPGSQPTTGPDKPAARPESRAAVVKLAHVTPAAAQAVLDKLLSMRLRSLLRYAPSPDGKGLIVSGPAGDVQQFQDLVAGIDAAPELDRDVRQLRLVAENAAAVLARAQELYGQTSAGKREQVTASLDATSKTVTVVGTRDGLAAFTDVLRTAETGAKIDRESRLIELRHAKASQVAATLGDLVKSSRLFAASGAVEPVLEPVEVTNSLLVAAQPGQLPILEQMIRSLDNQQVGERPPLRILRLKTTDAANLAQVLTNTYAQRPPEQKVKFPVDIQVDAATNTLLVSAHADLFPEIEKIVGELNETRPDKDGREIRIFPLKVAQAEELAKTIDQMYPMPPVPLDPRTRAPRPDLQQPREIVVRADRMTNSLIVDAPGARLSGFEQLVKQLDQQKLPENVELRTYRVQRAQLDAVATTLRGLATNNGLTRGVPIGAGASASVAISTEPVSRTLIVSGPSEIFTEVEKVLKQIEAAPERPATGLKMYPLQHARAERLSPLFTKLLTARLKEQQAREGPVAVDPASLLDVAADSATNSLIISAPEAIQTIAGELVKALDTTAAAGGRAMVRVVPLVHADPQAAAAALNAATPTMDLPSGGKVTVLATAGSRSLVLSGVESDLKQVEELVKSLDAKPSGEGAIDVRTIPLKHARAESVAPMVEQLLVRPSVVDQLPPWQKLDYMRNQKGEVAPVRAIAERRLNAVVVTGPSALIELAQQIVTDLDVDPAVETGGVRPVRVITLENADAAAVAANVTAIFADDDSGESKPTVRVDVGSNLLIVRASDRQMATITPLVEKIDKATLTSSRELRLIPVDRSRADAKLMAETLQRLLEQRGGTKVEVISAEELLKGKEKKEEGKRSDAGSTNRVDLPGSLLDARSITRLPYRAENQYNKTSSHLAAVQGRRAAPGNDRGPSGPLMPMVAASLIAAIPDDSPQPPEAKKGDGEQATVTIAVDPATNSLIVVGSPRMAARVAELAAQLEKQMPTEPGKIRVVTLPESVDARAVAQIVGSAATQIGRSSATNPGGFTGKVGVDADPSGGALIVSANDTDFSVLAELIAAISRPAPSASLTVKVYPLSNVTAARAVRAVGDLLSADPRGQQARRVRSLQITIPGAPTGSEQPVGGTIDPGAVRITADPGGGSIIVAAPRDSIPLLDRFISLIDQSPVTDRFAIRRFELKNAKADATARTLQGVFDASRQGPNSGEMARAAFQSDERTNMLLATGTEGQLKEVERLLVTLDVPLADDGTKVAIIPLQVARPASVRATLETVLVGRDPAKKERLQISAADDSNLLVIRALPEQIEQARVVIAEMDRAETAAFPVRSIKLERADAERVAKSLQQFFDDRARATSRQGQRGQQRHVAVVGDKRSGTLVVSASDEEFAQVQSLVKEFDSATSRDLEVKIIPLQNARATEVRQTVDSIVFQLLFQDRDNAQRDTMLVEVDERSNSVVIMGGGETAQTVEKIIRALDMPRPAESALAIKAVKINHADPRTVATAIQSATGTPNWPRWRGNDPDAVRAEVDQRSRSVVLIGRADRLEQAAKYAEQLDAVGATPDQAIESMTLKFARADQIAGSLQRFFQDRARTQGAEARVSVIGSRDGNVLIVSAPPEEMGIVRQMLAQMDQPDEGEGRKREIFQLQNADARELASVLQEQFPRSMASREGLVVVTAQPTTNSVIVSAPDQLQDRVRALIMQLDAPPNNGSTQMVTVTLSTARAEDVADSLKKALPASVKVVVTPVKRTNTLLLTGSTDAISVVMEQIGKLDSQPAKAAAEFRRLKLNHADAYELASTLKGMVGKPANPSDPMPAISFSSKDNTILISATADQQDEIKKMIDLLDVQAGLTRTMEFVPLKFADAKATATALEVFFGKNAPEAVSPAARNVTIIANPLSKSLVISAEQTEWPSIRALLEKLDNEQYDTSRRLEIVALRHADAVSLAATLAEAFNAPIRAELERSRAVLRNLPQNFQGFPGRVDDGRPNVPSSLVPPEESVSVVAERLTNSLIVSAAPPMLERIKAVAKQLDVEEFARLPEARLIPLRIGPASQIAAALRQMFTDHAPGSPGIGAAGLRAVVITGEDKSNTLIVRAEEGQFAQIKALAESLQQEGDKSKTTVRVLKLANIPAGRVVLTVRNTFASVAKDAGETLSLEVDRTANALVIASSEKVFEQIKKVVEELDALPGLKPGGPEANAVPGLGQTIFIIDVENNSPEQIRKQLEEMGLTKPAPQDRAGVVAEPVTLVPLTSRRALAVVASPADGQAVATLVRSLDAAPMFAEQQVAIVRLKTAQAQAVSSALDSMLKTRPQDAASSPAAALVEQVRRLSIQRDGVDKANLSLDLTKPIRILPEPQTNSVVLTSTKENVAALAEVVKLLDRLPVGEAVVVRFFPLQNASAQRIGGIVRDLFAAGDRLRLTPATQIRGEPATEAGKALASQVAVTVDDRTNSLVVAGREEAVALVEVLIRQLDSDKAAGWIEPVIVPLKHADAAKLAKELKAILVDGIKESPESSALQRQVARIRVSLQGAAPTGPERPVGGTLDTDIFAPLSSLVIVPEESLNALIVLGSAPNAAAVSELVKMLDVPAAAAENSVRIYPLRFAAADRVAGVLRDIFKQQVAAGAIRTVDDLIISADLRTNAMVVSTSPRSFLIVEKLMQQLDSQPMSPTVGMHVLSVSDGNVADLAPKIERLMRERIDSATRSGTVRSPSDTFSIQAEPATRSLIVVASDENYQLVQDLVKALASGAGALAATEAIDLIQVNSARVEDLAPSIRELYVDKQNAKRGTDSVRVTPDARLNALVVRGTAEDIAAVRELVGRLESAPLTAVTEIKRIELKRADAVEAVRLIQGVLAGRPLAGGRAVGSKQALLLRFLHEKQASDLEGKTGRAPTEAEISGAIQEQVTLTPEQRTNSVVVVAPTRMMVMIEELIADLDTTSAGARSIEVFRLKNADARAMAEILRDLFNLRQQGSTLVLMPGRTPDRKEQPQDQNVVGPQPAGEIIGANLYPTSDERQQLAITIDARTNSLLVSATAEYLEQVRKVVEDLDRVEANEREQLVYPLRNTKAIDVAKTMREYFKSEADTLRATLGPDRAGSILRLLEREVTVQGDEKSNRVIVGVSPRYKESIDSIVKELDATPPQVMIQVLLAEVTLDNSNTWGMDLKVGPFGGDGYRVASLAANAGVLASLGVPNLAVSSADFELLIRSLEVQGRLEVLSRPQILVKNNEAARIQVGEQISVPDAQQTLSSGNQVTSVTKQDLGIILQVTPSVSDDGFVSMSVKPEISSLSSKTTQISENFQAPVVDIRKIDTNISVRDGETIVIGGLIQTRDDERKTKIPILGDIPLAGLMFRSNQFEHTKTELLVILTPRVIRSGSGSAREAIRRLTEEEIGRLSGESRNKILEAMPLPDPFESEKDRDQLPRDGNGQGPAAAPGPAPTDVRRSKPEEPPLRSPYEPGPRP